MNIKLHNNTIFDFAVICIDLAIVVISCFLSREILASFINMNGIQLYFVLSYAAITIFTFYIYEFYTKNVRKKYEVLLSVFISVLVTNLAVIVIEFLNGTVYVDNQKLFFVVMPTIMFTLLGGWKVFLMQFIRHIEGSAKLLVIESKNVNNGLARKIKYSYLELYQAWYTQIDVTNKEEINHFLNTEFKEYESIFISPSIPEKLRNLFVSQAVSHKKEIYVLPDLYNISVMKNETVQFDDTPALRMRPFGLTKLQAFMKRAVDIIASSIGIIITLPISLFAFIAIRLDSPGPAIYKQQRVTIDQKIFNIYKFRTMVSNAEKHTGPTLATDDDPRITKFGKFLRSTRLDELPQLFNILLGTMSIVGPRPERSVFVYEYCDTIENYDKRFFVKAGLTGLAQVYSRYDTSPQDKTLYDLLYIKDYSLWLDIKLILLTIKIMFVKESAGGVKAPADYQKANIDAD